MKNQDLDFIINLIESGNNIYAKAIDNIDNHGLVRELDEIIRIKEYVALQLRAHREPDSDVEEDDIPSYAIKARELYTDTIKDVSFDKEKMYLKQLQMIEEKTLSEVSDVLRHAQPGDRQEVLFTVQEELISCQKKIANIAIID